MSEARRRGISILLQVVERYRTVSELSCQIATATKATYSDRSDFETRGIALLKFDRSGSLEVQGQTPGGAVPSHSYEIVSDARGVRTRLAVEGADAWSKHARLEDALAALSGVTKRGPVLLCGFLYELKWTTITRNFPSDTIASGMMSTVTLKGEEVCNEAPCHVLEAKCAGLDVVLYVRKADMMLAGCEESLGSDDGTESVRGSRYPMTRMSMTHEFNDVKVKMR